jgi:exodeoxyribonuclease VII small subunit
MPPKAKDTRAAAPDEAAAIEPAADLPSYEDARDELLATVRTLEDGGLPLEESLALWERGEELATICQFWLDGARERLASRRPEAADRQPD